MRILHVEAGRHLYGGALQVHYLTSALCDVDVDNILVCPEGAALPGILDPRVKVHAIKMNGDLDIGFIFRLRKIIKEEKVDMVHLHSRRGADTLGLITAKVCGVPAVISRRVDNPESKLVSKLKYHGCDHVVAISQKIRDLLVSQGVCNDQITTVHSAVDSDEYDLHTDPRWFRKAFGIPEESLVLGIVAQLIQRKGHEVLFSALENAIDRLPDFRLLVFGQGPLEQQLKERVAKSCLAEKIKFCGFRVDLPKMIANLDVLVHPAFAEGLGVSLLQANSCGVPIIAANAGGIPEIVQHNKNGWLFEPGAVDQLSRLLIDTMNDRQMLAQIRNTCRESVIERFSIESMVHGNKQIYKAVLSQTEAASMLQNPQG